MCLAFTSRHTSGRTHGQPPGDTPAWPTAAEPAQARMRPVTVAITSKLERGRDTPREALHSWRGSDRTFSWHLPTLSLTQHMQLSQTHPRDRSPPVAHEEEKRILRPRGSILEVVCESLCIPQGLSDDNLNHRSFSCVPRHGTLFPTQLLLPR